LTPEELAAQFEQYTYEYFLDKALEQVPATMDTREGSIIYDAIAPAAYSFAELAMEMRNILLNAYTQTATGEFLDYKAAERGIEREPATFAKALGHFTNETGGFVSVAVGDRFASLGEEPIYYTVTDTLAEQAGQAELTAETSGEGGNSYVGQLLPVTPQTGLANAYISEITIPARDQETDDELRQRLLNNVDTVNFGGNVSDYISYATELADVSAVQVYPTWDGGGTVKLVVLNNQHNAPSQALIDDVQEAVDPTDAQGEGYGIAPVGHTVTVVAPAIKTINTVLTVDVDADHTITDVTAGIQEAIQDYFSSLREAWGTVSANGRGYEMTVYRSQITLRVLQVTGVVNVESVLLNNENADIALQFTDEISELPIAGTVTVND